MNASQASWAVVINQDIKSAKPNYREQTVDLFVTKARFSKNIHFPSNLACQKTGSFGNYSYGNFKGTREP
jgi:hypothetical protein